MYVKYFVTLTLMQRFADTKLKMFYFYFCCVLLIPYNCNSMSLQDPEKLSNVTLLNKKPNTSNIQAKIPVVSEGGTIILNNTTLKENHTNDINLEKEFEKDEGKSVVARKGVVYNPKEDKTSGKEPDVIKKNPTNETKNVQIISLPEKVADNISRKNDILKNIIHKPLILSYEALSQTDKENNIVINENEPSIKVHDLKTSGHPGMIVPIVITILVVPMFAVVGYMALKRGKEAWKNRHYKRMDFLLDGMYND